MVYGNSKIWMANCVVVQNAQMRQKYCQYFPNVFSFPNVPRARQGFQYACAIIICGCDGILCGINIHHLTKPSYDLCTHSALSSERGNGKKTQSNRVIHLVSFKNEKFSFQNGSTKCCMIELMLTTQYKIYHDWNGNSVGMGLNDWLASCMRNDSIDNNMVNDGEWWTEPSLESNIFE